MLLTDRTLFAAAIALCALAAGRAAFLWRRGFSRDDWWCYGLLCLALIPAAGAMLARGFSLQRCPVTNLFEAIMFLVWAMLGCHVAVGFISRLRFLSALAAPLLVALGVFGLQPGLDQPAPVLDLSRGLVSLHAALILLAYGTFGLSAAAALMFLAQERNLKLHKLRAVLSLLPSIERLSKVVVDALAVGLALLTVGLVLGIPLVRATKEAPVRGDPKVLWSVLVWGIYLALLISRTGLRRGPRWMAWGSALTFAFVILTFWGTNLLSPLHQN